MWQEYLGDRVAVHASRGSYAERRAPDVLRACEVVSKELERLLEPETFGPRLDVYLVDAPAEPGTRTADAAGRDVSEVPIVNVVEPEAPSFPSARELASTVVARWFGNRAAEAQVFVSAIAGVAAASARVGPTLEEANEWVRGELAEARTVSLFVDSGSPVENQPGPALVSFGGYLVSAFGEPALREFFRLYDPSRRDSAAVSVYQRPLGSLEETWLASLRQRRGLAAAAKGVVHQLAPLLRPYRWRALEVLVYMVYGLAYSLAIPLSARYLIDHVLPRGERTTLLVFVLVLLAIYVLDAAVGLRRAYVTSVVTQRIAMGLRAAMFERMQRLPHSFYARAKVGDLITRLTADLDIIEVTIGQVLGVGVYLVLMTLAAAVTLLVLSPILGAVVLVVVPLFGVAYFMLRSRLQQASYEQQELTGQLMASVQENLSAHAVVKAFGLEKPSISVFRGRLESLFRVAVRLTVIGALFETSFTLAGTLGQLIVIGVGGWLVIDGHITIGTLVAFIGLLPSLFQPVAVLSSVGRIVQGAAGSFERVAELLEEPTEITDKPDAVMLPPLAREIKLERVTFGYSDDRSVLNDLSVSIQAGMHTVVVGRSGSGKSTLANLLLRFWDPQTGRIEADGHDLRDVTVESLRGQIGLVFQDTFVFDSTLRENIAIGRPDASDEEVTAAAHAAELDDFVDNLPAGYDTVLGERGVRMSGGQRQRLAIARALLRDPSVLILDEATSALDAETERQILRTLSVLTHGRTTISITHRLSVAAGADRILVLDRGELVEDGAHQELISAGGPYQRLYEEQTSYAVGAGGVDPGGSGRLRTVPLFSELEQPALVALAHKLALEKFDPGEDIVRQGEPGAKLYLIRRGRVDVIVGADDSERIINVLTEGDFFGEVALVTGDARNATVRAATATDTYSLDRLDFLELLEREPNLREVVSRTIAERRAAVAHAMRASAAV